MTGKFAESIRKTLERSFASRSSHEHTVFMITASVLGATCGALAVLFEKLVEFFEYLFFEVSWNFTGGDSTVFKWLVIPLLPALGGLLVGLLTWRFRMGAESASAAEVMKWTAVDGGVVKPRIVWFRTLVSTIFLGSGGSGGPEGPIAQVCGAWGSTIGQFLNASSERLRLLVGCGAAAGIAAAFNAPIAGVIFTVELVLGDFNVISFLPIVISSVMATTVKRLMLGEVHVFSAPPYALVSSWEIFLYAILGVLCGLAARLFVATSARSEEFFKKKVRIHPALKPALGGLLVGIIGIWWPEIFGGGFETMDVMLAGEMALSLAFTLVFIKIIATAISLGSGGSGGIFAPSLFIGCMTGGAFGYLVNMAAPDAVASPGAYAMVGLAAVMAAVAHAPLTNILMGYELTGNYEIILPIMTSCIMATFVITRFSPESMFTEKLSKRGIRLWRGRDLAVMDRIKVGEIMTNQFTTIPENTPFRRIMELIATSRDSYFPVVDASGNLTGIISIQNVREILLDSVDLADIVVAKEIATEHVITVIESNNLNEAMERFAMKEIEQLPVVAMDDSKKIIGMLKRVDVMAAYKKEVLKKTSQD
ncbi:MAG: chloride channel protein [Nitrospinae bacterium]|nr:chloride channel protein [Nitrospinota bacterium]